MLEVIIHGRGGQGAVTAVELIAQAAIAGNKYAQAFPSFGPERRGAPVTAFLRIADEQIFTREKIESPDAVIVLDPTLIGLVDVCAGLKKGGDLIINCTEKVNTDEFQKDYKVSTVDASKIAIEVLGVPITNTAIIGAFLKVAKIIEPNLMNSPLDKRFGKLAEKNLNAMKRAYDETKSYDFSGETGSDSLEADETFKIEALHVWDELEVGGEIIKPGSSRNCMTGTWRTLGIPVIDQEKCVKCGICWIVCPEMSYTKNDEGYYDWDDKYCKGCAICVEECISGAIEMREE